MPWPVDCSPRRRDPREAPPGYEADGSWLTNGAMHPAVAGAPLVPPARKIEARDVLEAAAAGDAVAARVVDEAADALALACLNYCRMVDPHAIAFAGGVATDDLLRRVRARYDSLRWNILDDPAEIRLAAGGETPARSARRRRRSASPGDAAAGQLGAHSPYFIQTSTISASLRVFCAFSFGSAGSARRRCASAVAADGASSPASSAGPRRK